jgi:hypothetical protein
MLVGYDELGRELGDDVGLCVLKVNWGGMIDDDLTAVIPITPDD